MEFIELTQQEFTEFANQHPLRNFWQTSNMAKMREERGFHTYYVGVKEHGRIIAGTMLSSVPTFMGYEVFYLLRGPLIDFKDQNLYHFFHEKLIAFLKKRKCLYLHMDPYLPYKEHDLDGNVVEGGFDNSDVVEMLMQLGYVHEGFTKGMDVSKEPRWMSILDLKEKNKEDVFASFSYQTRQDIRKFQKYGVKMRELDESELELLDKMERETSQRHDFEVRDLSYYQNLYKFFGKDKIKTILAYLDLHEYGETILEEFNKTENEIHEIEAFLVDHPNSSKKIKRLKTAKEYYCSLEKKLSELQEYKNNHITELPLACSLFIINNKEIWYMIGASDYNYRNFRGPYAVQWTMIQKAIEEDYDVYNFYGISGYFNQGEEGYGIFDFKRGFHATVVELIGDFEYVVNSSVYKLYRFLRSIKHIIKR